MMKCARVKTAAATQDRSLRLIRALKCIAPTQVHFDALKDNYLQTQKTLLHTTDSEVLNLREKLFAMKFHAGLLAINSMLWAAKRESIRIMFRSWEDYALRPGAMPEAAMSSMKLSMEDISIQIASVAAYSKQILNENEQLKLLPVKTAATEAQIWNQVCTQFHQDIAVLSEELQVAQKSKRTLDSAEPTVHMHSDKCTHCILKFSNKTAVSKAAQIAGHALSSRLQGMTSHNLACARELLDYAFDLWKCQYLAMATLHIDEDSHYEDLDQEMDLFASKLDRLCASHHKH